MELDIYTWLAQRLHRVSKQRRAAITWAALRDQFGPGYDRLRDFRRNFLGPLQKVLSQYPQARVEVVEQGLILANSRPPVAKRLITVSKVTPALDQGAGVSGGRVTDRT